MHENIQIHANMLFYLVLKVCITTEPFYRTALRQVSFWSMKGLSETYEIVHLFQVSFFFGWTNLSFLPSSWYNAVVWIYVFERQKSLKDLTADNN